MYSTEELVKIDKDPLVNEVSANDRDAPLLSYSTLVGILSLFLVVDH